MTATRNKTTGDWVARESGTHGEDVSARTSSRRYYNSRDKQSTYTWKAARTNLAGEVVFYIKHTDQDTTLVIDSIQCKSTVACEFVVCLVSGTATGGTPVIPVNWSAAGSSSTGTDKSSALQGNVGGIHTPLDVGDIDVIAGKREVFDTEGALRIQNGYGLAIMCDKAGTVNVNVFGEFE